MQRRREKDFAEVPEPGLDPETRPHMYYAMKMLVKAAAEEPIIIPIISSSGNIRKSEE
jgi:hypothetical protein